MNVNIQNYTQEHCGAVLNLVNDWSREFITYGIVPDAPEDLERFDPQYFLLAFQGDKLIGFIRGAIQKDNEFSVFPHGSDCLEIIDLYIAKEFRGGGIGAELLRCAENIAKGNGITNVFLSSETIDAEMIRRFYKNQGYSVWVTKFYKRFETDIRTFPLNTLKPYRFVVIFARYNGKWLFCKHKERGTWELPGGHIENNETPLDAAKRELWEETGAVKFDITAAFDYSVHRGEQNTDFSNGQVFYAEVTALELPPPEFEMREVQQFEALPLELTYPDIYPVIFAKLQDWTNNIYN